MADNALGKTENSEKFELSEEMVSGFVVPS